MATIFPFSLSNPVFRTIFYFFLAAVFYSFIFFLHYLPNLIRVKESNPFRMSTSDRPLSEQKKHLLSDMTTMDVVLSFVQRGFARDRTKNISWEIKGTWKELSCPPLSNEWNPAWKTFFERLYFFYFNFKTTNWRKKIIDFYKNFSIRTNFQRYVWISYIYINKKTNSLPLTCVGTQNGCFSVYHG